MTKLKQSCKKIVNKQIVEIASIEDVNTTQHKLIPYIKVRGLFRKSTRLTGIYEVKQICDECSCTHYVACTPYLLDFNADFDIMHKWMQKRGYVDTSAIKIK